MSLDFLFKDPPAATGDLVFLPPTFAGGSTDLEVSGGFAPLTCSIDLQTIAAQVDATIDAQFEPLTADIDIAPVAEVEIDGQFEPLTADLDVGPFIGLTLDGLFEPLAVAATALYSSNTDRPIVGTVSGVWQKATITEPRGFAQPHQEATPTPVGWNTDIYDGTDTRAGVAVPHEAGTPTGLNQSTPYQDATPLVVRPQFNYWEDATRLRQISKTDFQEATDVRSMRYFDFQDMQRDRRPSRRTRWQPASRSNTGYIGRFEKARRSVYNFGWDFQAARPPNGQNFIPPVEPPFNPCYMPDANLVFADGLDDGNTRLVFVCEQHAGQPTTTSVVPVRSVYVVINDISLRRVAGNIVLPTLGMSLSIDAGSWTWGFQASLPADTLDDLQPGGSGPVELEASINGNFYRVLVEQISRERSFGSSSIRVSGRGKTALLSSPYAPVLTFANSQQRTAQQLMADVLTFNEVPLAWTVDWQLTDWPVPAGVFNVTGTYIDGLNSIAGAAGAYLQPHPTNQELSVLLKYPVAPWEWNTVTPDFELPAAVTVQEGIEWLEKPDYNRVFVSGTSAGVLGQVTRTGSGGTLPAQMVTDALITHADAARQRGLSILGDTGKQARVRLRLPVLPETGVISPGNFVRYVDGTQTRLGLVRSTSVDAGWPEVWQSIELETHL